MTDYDELLDALRHLRDVLVYDIPPPEGDTIPMAPVVEIGSSGRRYVFLPCWNRGEMLVECWAFGPDGGELLHDFLQPDPESY